MSDARGEALPAGATAPLHWARGEERLEFFQGPHLHEQFDAVAAARPSVVCLVDDASSSTMTYAQVQAGANTLARTLARLGVGPDMGVGILVERSPAVVVAMLAVLKTGGFYVPLDPSYQSDRLAGYIQDSQATVVITQMRLAAKAELLAMAASEAAGTPAPTVFIIEESLSAAAGDAGEGEQLSLPGRAHDRAIAYCMFTSGSTGRPKGVEVTHGGLRDLIAFNVEKFQLGPADVFCLNTTVCFDPYVTYLYSCLAVGGRLVIPRPDGHVDPAYMATLCRDTGVTVMEVVPSLAVQYVMDIAPMGADMKLRHVLAGGEALNVGLVKSMYEALPGCEMVWNSYGPTEVTVTAVTGAIPRGAARVPLGRPDHNVHCYVSTYPETQEQEAGFVKRMCAVGQPGELLLSGPRLGCGYRGRLDLTAEKYVPNPFYDTTADLPVAVREHYRLVYRTGDLVKWVSDGQLEFLGRIDSQVKINGVRMELAEVEAAMTSALGVARAAAVAWKDPKTSAYRLAGYVVAEAGRWDGDAAAARAREACVQRLVPAMVPSVVVPMEGMKLLPNGKTDLKSLPQPDWAALGSSRDYQPPADELERTLTDIWASAIDLPEGQRMGTDDDFFELGGTSVLAGRINSIVRRKLAIDIPGLVIFQACTIKGMAEHIRPMLQDKQGSDGSETDGSQEADGSPGGHTATVTGKALPLWLCTVLQFVGIVFPGFVASILFLGPTIAIMCLYIYTSLSLWQVVLASPLLLPLGYFLSMASCVLLKWIILGRQRPGTYPIWSLQYLRWWTVRGIYMEVANSVLPPFQDTEIMSIFLRCMGAKVGRRVQLDTVGGISDWDLLTIGDDTVAEAYVSISASTLAAGAAPGDPGTITFAPVVIGKGVTLGTQCAVCPGAVLPDGSVVKTGTATSSPESVKGKPIDGIELRRPNSTLPIGLQILCSHVYLILSGFLSLASIVPAMFLWKHLSGYDTWNELLSTTFDCWFHFSFSFTTECRAIWKAEVLSMLIWPAAGFVVAQLYLLVVIACKWLLVGRLTPEKVSRTDLAWRVRVHMWRLVLESPATGAATDPWASTHLYNVYLRCLGIKVGKQAWLGEKFKCAEPDLLSIEDYVSMCSAVTVLASTEACSAPVRFLEGCAVTNEATVLPGVVVHPEAVLGVYSLARTNQVFPPYSIVQGETVLHPGHDIEIVKPGAVKTPNPKAVSWWIYARYNLCCYLATVVLVPATAMVRDLPAALLMVSGLYWGGIPIALATVPVAAIASMFIQMVWMALMKLLLLPRSEGAHPLFGLRASAWQLHTVLGYCYGGFISIAGSQFFVWYLRMQGAKVGKGTCILSAHVVEADVVTIGDGAVVNEHACFMGHTVERRAVCITPLSMGPRSTLGTMSILMPGCTVEEGATVGDLSLVMKQELVPQGAYWCGVPAVPVRAAKRTPKPSRHSAESSGDSGKSLASVSTFCKLPESRVCEMV